MTSFLFLYGRPASNWLTCSWGIVRSRIILYASAYQTRPARERRTGRPRQWPTAFVPGRIEQGISTLMLRRTRSRRFHAGAAFAEMAARSFTGLERKGGRCCTAPFRYVGRLISWPYRLPWKTQLGTYRVRPCLQRSMPRKSAMRHIKAAPLLRCRAAYFTFEKNHALYQRHCFSRSARTPRCNHCKARTGLRLS